MKRKNVIIGIAMLLLMVLGLSAAFSNVETKPKNCSQLIFKNNNTNNN